MNFDVIGSMFIYTIATVAFYMLGAGVLSKMGLVPSGKEMIATLTHIYTETFGGWAKWVFYAGAIVAVSLFLPEVTPTPSSIWRAAQTACWPRSLLRCVASHRERTGSRKRAAKSPGSGSVRHARLEQPSLRG